MNRRGFIGALVVVLVARKLTDMRYYNSPIPALADLAMRQELRKKLYLDGGADTYIHEYDSMPWVTR